ncbi:LysR family transcriptional regulator [Acuticoccus sediminis]|uniref:LysR family transcriptional regulator n=2 Tax=Acuticoccus sediminis TaxID=2184697 RepID=A0A8B2NHR7_9HYPH|nr:LysR family transcriptional regulator [Acuticoccus sediminis]
MPDIALDLRYLKYAMLAAEHGSFRRTAEMLNVPQSTVSRRIQLLEHRIGIPLFERGRSGARVTLAGERFLRDAAVGADHLHQAVNGLALVKRGHSGKICIGIMASLASGFLAELLGAFHSRFPAVDIKIEEVTSQASACAVLNGRLDAAFMPGDPKLPGCRAEKLWDEKIFVAVPYAHPIAALAAATWDDIRHETFLVTADAAGPEIEDYLVRQLSGPAFHPKISVQRVGRENLLNMVDRGFGITLTTDSTLGITYPNIRFLPIISSEDKVSSSVVWSASNQNPALKHLVEMSLNQARRSTTGKKCGD